MRRAYQPTATELAILVAIMVQRYAKERGREVSRFRLARSSLRRLAIRDRLRDALVDEWIEVMALEYGWVVFAHDEEFLLLKSEITRTWTRIATKRCDDFIKRLRGGDGTAVNDAENEIEPTPDTEEGDED